MKSNRKINTNITRNHRSAWPIKMLIAAGISFSFLWSTTQAKPPLQRQTQETKKSDPQREQKTNRPNRDSVDPQATATRAITSFDSNGDNELQLEELTAALKAQQEKAKENARRRDASSDRKLKEGDESEQSDKGKAEAQKSEAEKLTKKTSRISKRVLAKFDENESAGLDLQELVAFIEFRRQMRGSRGEAGSNTQSGEAQIRIPKTKKNKEKYKGAIGGAGVVPKRPQP